MCSEQRSGCDRVVNKTQPVAPKACTEKRERCLCHTVLLSDKLRLNQNVVRFPFKCPASVMITNKVESHSYAAGYLGVITEAQKGGQGTRDPFREPKRPKPVL